MATAAVRNPAANWKSRAHQTERYEPGITEKKTGREKAETATTTTGRIQAAIGTAKKNE